MEKIDFINKSLRLRYEAFSKFATEINQANTIDDIGKAITSNIKFILDAFMIRFSLSSLQDALTFEIFRGQYTCYQNHSDFLSEFEAQCLQDGLPLEFTQEKISQNIHLHNSIFHHEKIVYLFILPLQISHEQQIILFIANKNHTPFTEIDFRFARLFCELLTTKISQLLLTEKIANKNAALEAANEELSRLNQKVQKLNTGLEKKVKERTHKLSEAHKELNILFYRTSHDFRRPLTSILGLTNLIETSKKEEDIPVLTQLLKKSVAELDKMLSKLQTISLTDLEEEAIAQIHFPEIIQALKNKFHPVLTEHSVHFSYSIKNLKKPFYSYPPILSAILLNLIENAIQYRASATPFVKVEVSKKGAHVLILVIDNGEGILEHLQPKVFDLYFRASERSYGNGLGLYIVKKLAEKIQGKVTFESMPGRGSVFKLVIPFVHEKRYHASISRISKSSDMPYLIKSLNL